MKELITTTFRIAIIALSFLAFGLSVSNAEEVASGAGKSIDKSFIERGHGRHGDGLGMRFVHRILCRLDLTDAQESEIKAILDEQQTKITPYVAELEKNREAMRELSKDGVFNEAQVREIATQQAAAMTELIVAKEQGKAKIFAVLTEAQRAKAQEILDDWGPHGCRFGR